MKMLNRSCKETMVRIRVKEGLETMAAMYIDFEKVVLHGCYEDGDETLRVAS